MTSVLYMINITIGSILKHSKTTWFCSYDYFFCFKLYDVGYDADFQTSTTVGANWQVTDAESGITSCVWSISEYLLTFYSSLGWIILLLWTKSDTKMKGKVYILRYRSYFQQYICIFIDAQSIAWIGTVKSTMCLLYCWNLSFIDICEI